MKCVNIHLNQYFPNDQHMMLQNHAQMKGPFNVQKTLRSKFIYIILDSSLQLAFKNFHLYGSGAASEKTVHNYLKRLITFSLFSTSTFA